MQGTLADQAGRHWSGNFEGPVAGVIVDPFLDQDAARCVEGEHLAAGLPLGEARAHGALLKERRGATALLESREGSRGVVAEDDHSVREVEFESSRVEGEYTREGLPADLVTHVVRVRQGADDDLALAVGPPSKDHAPAVQGGVPGDDDDVGVASFARKKGRVQGAGDKGPEGRPEKA